MSKILEIKYITVGKSKSFGNGTTLARACWSIGNQKIIKEKTLGLFCSIRCPGDIILKTYDLAKKLRDKGVTIVSGFHSPMEGECLRILLCGKQPIVICPARNIENMRIPKDWKKPLDDGRLLILSPFNKDQKRITTKTAKIRNEFVATIADKIFVAYAAPNSKTYRFCSNQMKKGKLVYTFNSPKARNLTSLGAKHFSSGLIKKFI